MDTRPPKPGSDQGPLTRMGHPTAFYNHAIAPIWERVTVYDGATVFLRQFAEVTQEQALLWAAHFCQGDLQRRASSVLLQPDGRSRTRSRARL